MRTEWYAAAAGGKAALKFDINIRWGSAWLKYQNNYTQVLKDREKWLRQQGNPKAAQMIRLHLETLPTHLPYIVNITGFEWPVIASALLAAVGKSEGRHHKDLQTLYQRLVKERTEAKHDSAYGQGSGGYSSDDGG